jgi:F0F1-type ATP synthase delta subunit
MKTESSNSSNIDIIMSKLSSFTIDLPVAQLLSELQVIIERLSFSGLVYRDDDDDAALLSELDLLFEGEISKDIMDFLHWLASKRILAILAGKMGHSFLNHCNKVYSGVKEIKFITSIDLSSQYRNAIMLKLRTLYPLPARIVCDVNPLLKAGFVIQDNSKTVDRSLKACMEKNMRVYVNHHASTKKVIHV